MILIADSGSTKTTWSILAPGKDVLSCETQGINPFFIEKEEILQLLNKEFTLPKEGVSSVYFYGAGCVPEKERTIAYPLSEFFNTQEVVIHTDLLAAARSLCKDQPGIVCILGTGSNSCYYDGKEISDHVSPLGFILGDEGSGANLGKRFLSDLLKNQLPEYLKEDFFGAYPMEISEILENVYRKPFPNRFLSGFTRFIAKHIEDTAVSGLVEDCFREFVKRNLLQYKQSRQIFTHFTGSIAYHFRDQLMNVMIENNLIPGRIMQHPMPGLIDYHLHIHNNELNS